MGDIPQHLSLSFERFTPPRYCEASRFVMGNIDLDPCSSKVANRIVKADRIFTAQRNGFIRNWAGRVLCNPPGGICDAKGVMLPPRAKGVKRAKGTYIGGRSSAAAWWQKCLREYLSKRVTELVFYGFSVELCQTSQQFEDESIFESSALCFPADRIRFWKENETGELVEDPSPTHANVIAYLGRKAQKFAEAFGEFGQVVTL